MTLTKIALTNGVWTGMLTGGGNETPKLQVTHQGHPIDGLQLNNDATQAGWQIEITIPAHLISDGVQTFIISDDKGQTLNSFAFLAGDALAEDIRTEMDLLRSELDLLKKAFRQHCQDS